MHRRCFTLDELERDAWVRGDEAHALIAELCAAEDARADIFDSGYSEGEQAGFEAGYEEGLTDGQADAAGEAYDRGCEETRAQIRESLS